mgnify:CR=1 FL=1
MWEVRYLIKEGTTTYQFNDFREWRNLIRTLKRKNVPFECWQEIELFRR